MTCLPMAHLFAIEETSRFSRILGGKKYDMENGVYLMLAVVISTFLLMPYNHHMLYDRYAHKGPYIDCHFLYFEIQDRP